MPGRQSPHTAISGKLREYCIRNEYGERIDLDGDGRTVWAETAREANVAFGFEPHGGYRYHASTVRRIGDEAAETLRDIPS